MPFVKVNIEEVIEQKCQQSESFKKNWDESREEYRLIGEMVQLRKAEKVTQCRLAKLTGNKQQVISRIENKENMPTLRTFCNLLSAIGYELQIVKKKKLRSEIIMTEWEKAEAGLFYMPPNDPKIVEGMKKSQQLNYDYNMLRPAQMEEREKMIRDNFGKVGKNFKVEQPFYADHWGRILVGENFYSNYNFKVLAGNKIYIGDNVMFGPDCGLYAAGHPFDAEFRATGAEYAWPIKIGNNVWVGGGTKIVGGVSIGDNTVIAAGSVVVKSIPANVLAGGNPCKVIREIKPEDDDKYREGFKCF